MRTNCPKCDGIGRHWVSSRNADAGETAGRAVRSPGSSIIGRASSDSRRQTDGGPSMTSLGRMARPSLGKDAAPNEPLLVTEAA